jgi:hypothetical protein
MLEKLLEAIVGLTNALNAHAAALGAAPKATKGKAAAAEAPAAAQQTAGAVQQSATAQTATTAASPSNVAVTVNAQDAGNAMVKVANEVSREAAVAILAKYGAEKFAGVKPEQYVAFKADCDAALAAKTVPQQSGAGGLL